MGLQRATVFLGADPEVFVTQNGKLIGSEKFIPAEGWNYGGTRIVRDGFQAEFHLNVGEDFYEFGRSAHAALYYLTAIFANNSKGFGISMDEVINIPDEEWDTLEPESKILGCKPSLNIYEGQTIIEVGPEFRMRSASGHMHFGLKRPLWSAGTSPYVDHRRTLVPMLDWGVGTLCVLLNRGEHQAKRRSLYGKAGEYRLPEHGLEYRVPGNFWLLDPQLMYLVFGTGQFIIDILYSTHLARKAYDDQFMKDFNVEAVRTAIDTNDHQLAAINFELFAPFIEEYGRVDQDPLNKETLPHFRKFLTHIPALMEKTFQKAKTIDRWMKWNPEHDFAAYIKKF